jgi:hypothetical protein
MLQCNLSYIQEVIFLQMICAKLAQTDFLEAYISPRFEPAHVIFQTQWPCLGRFEMKCTCACYSYRDKLKIPALQPQNLITKGELTYYWVQVGNLGELQQLHFSVDLVPTLGKVWAMLNLIELLQDPLLPL